MKKIIFIGLALAMSFCITLSPSAAEKIKVGYITDLDLIPFFVALDKGYFKELGLDVESKEYVSGDDAYTALKGGSMDIHQNIGTNAAAKFYSQGIGFYIIRAYMLPSFKILTQKEAPYKALQDLKGKKYAVTSFAGTTYAISAMAFNALGIDLKKELEIKTFPPAVMQLELERGGVDAGILWEPLLSKVLKQGKLKVILDPHEVYAKKFNKRFIQSSIGCTKSFLDQNPEGARKYLQAIEKGLKFTLQNKDEANKTLAERWKGYTAEDIVKMRESWGDAWIMEGINNQQIEEIQFMFDKMFELTDYFKTKPLAKEVIRKL